ncbi:MAG TPA: PEGA domain-containing protein [Candidatus Acidoferrum sp.]
MPTRSVLSILLLVIFAGTSLAKDQPAQVLVWPATGQPVVRFSLGKFKEIGNTGKLHSYSIDVTAENLWGKRISQADFSLYLFDKDKVRIGDAWLSISDVAPGQVLKFQIMAQTSGTPVSTVLSPRVLPVELQPLAPLKKISMTVNSVPQGANVRLDDTEVGVTPKIIQVLPGKHTLEFTKDGFNTGHFPLEITPEDVSGGSVSYELGVSAHDTVELRDGTVISGDVESVSATEVLVRLGGTVQRFNRNQVKRIGLVPRDSASQ